MKFENETIGEVTVNDIFFKLQLYKKVKVDWKNFVTKDITEVTDWENCITVGYEVCISSEVKTLLQLLSWNYPIYGYCPHCKKNTAMNTHKNSTDDNIKIEESVWSYGDGAWEDEDFEDLSEIKMKAYLSGLFKNGGFHEKYFQCPMCRNIFRISLKIDMTEDDELLIRKVGQYPTLRDFSEIYTNRFDKILKKRDIREDYIAGLTTHDEGHNIAAYVYLRRIIEKLMLQIYQNTDRTLELQEFKARRFEDKIKELKDELPKLLQDKRLYEIVSAGIHQLSEEECAEHYPVLLDAVELILIEEEKKQKEKELIECIEKNINDIHSTVKKRVE
ncbi:MAG: hypothetical protein E7222_05450 [Clostridiales bacterium]|nr:hypothetical protein [Clostridiales bacterium]